MTATAAMTTMTATKMTTTETMRVRYYPQQDDDSSTRHHPKKHKRLKRQRPLWFSSSTTTTTKQSRHPNCRSVLEEATAVVGGTATKPVPAAVSSTKAPVGGADRAAAVARPSAKRPAATATTAAAANSSCRQSRSLFLDFRVPPPPTTTSAVVVASGGSAAIRQRQVREHHDRRRRHLLRARLAGDDDDAGGSSEESSAATLAAAACHRNDDEAPYCSVTFLDPRDDVVAAVDARGRVDIVQRRLVDYRTVSKLLSSKTTATTTTPPAHSTFLWSLQQHVPLLHSGGIVPTAASHYEIQSFQRGHALAVGMPTGEFRIYHTESAALATANRGQRRASTASQRPCPRRPQLHHPRHHFHSIPLSLPDPSSSSSSQMLRFVSCWRAYRPLRKYHHRAFCPGWTLADQLLRTTATTHGSTATTELHYDDDDDDAAANMVEMSGWNDPDAGMDLWSTPWDFSGGGDCRNRRRKRELVHTWDFCESPGGGSFLMGAHVAEDYVGVKLVEDRVDQTHVLVLGHPSSSSSSHWRSASILESRRAQSVAFCAEGRLLATGHRWSLACPSSSSAWKYEDDGDQMVLLWDLRMTQRPVDAVLPSFPREAAHLLTEDNAVAVITSSNLTDGLGMGGGPRTIELLEIPATEAGCFRSEPSQQFQSSLVCLSSLERAVLCRKLLPRRTSRRGFGATTTSEGGGAMSDKCAILASTVHDDGYCVEADHDSLYWTDLEREVASAECGDDRNNCNKPPRERTLMRLFDGTLTPTPEVAPIEPSRAQHPHGAAMRLCLEDRYGCSTSLRSLAVSQHGDRVVGGTCDGDLFVLGV